MALSRVGGSSAAATSIAIPAHVAGDLIVIWAYRDGSTTPPTVPTAGGTVPTFTTIDGPTGANSCSAVCAYAVAAGTTDTSGTWTNATGISVEVWRGAASPPIGGHAQSGGSVASGGNIAIPAITLTDPTGASVILAFAGWQTVTAWSAAPTGYTQRSQVATECEALSKNSTTSDGTFNVSGTASATGGTRTQQLEIIADLGNRVSQESVETLYSTTSAKARVSQESVEVLARYPVRGDRVSQVSVEILTPSPKKILPTFAGTSGLTFTVVPQKRFPVTFGGTSSLTATVTTGHGATKNFTLALAGTSSLSATLEEFQRFALTLAGTSSLTVAMSGTDNLILNLDGVGQLRFGPPDLSPVVFAGTSTFIPNVTTGHIRLVLAGRSSLVANLRRRQFPLALQGFGTLTFPWSLTNPGGRLSQTTIEVAQNIPAPEAILSQVTVEVARPRTGLHVWQHF